MKRFFASCFMLPALALLGGACGNPMTLAPDAATVDGMSGDASMMKDLAVVADMSHVAPSVSSTSPAAGAMGVGVNTTISAIFSEPMLPGTINQGTFVVKQGQTTVLGALTYLGTLATFKPASDLALGTTYSVTITAGVTNLAGIALAADVTWSFTTMAMFPVSPAPVLLGSAGTYVVLAKSAISNVPTSMITGNLGISPAAASFITGFSLVRVGTYSTAAQVVGKVYAADYDPPTPTNLTTSIGDMQTAYTDAAGRSKPDFLDLAGGAVGGLTLKAGLYKWASAVTIPTDLTISGAANDVWIFQVSNDLTMSAAKKVTLIGGAQAKNIVWQVAGAVSIGATSHFEGVVLCKTAITLGTGASVTGRLLAQTAVNLDSNAIVAPAM